MSAKFIVRDAVAKDFATITEIYGHHVLTGLASFEEQPPSRDELEKRFSHVLELGLPYLVAVDPSGHVGGYAYASLYRTRVAYRFTVEDSVYVAQGFERKGLGRILLTELIERCTQAGRRQMVAVIGDSANHGSIGLHAAMGFAMVGTMPAVGFKFGRWVDSVIMQRPLGGGETTLPG